MHLPLTWKSHFWKSTCISTKQDIVCHNRRLEVSHLSSWLNKHAIETAAKGVKKKKNRSFSVN